ncbi:hypothetical protein [Albirhodobacter sp. R86504]|uniref:hypothetical protein n=1 Tax=Albirhodobacter sp. R86504 TaxID=3093848 RepID=UPI00366C187F
MSDVFTMVSSERIDGFIHGARRVLTCSGVALARSWPCEIVEETAAITRLAHRRGEYFTIPTMRFVDEIMARHGVDVIAAYHHAVRGMPEDV